MSRLAAFISSALMTRVERKEAIEEDGEEELSSGSGGRWRPVRGIFHS